MFCDAIYQNAYFSWTDEWNDVVFGYVLHIILNKSFLKSICWVHRWFSIKSTISISLRFLRNLNRICVCWGVLGVQNVENAPDLIQCFTTWQCTYFWNRELQRVESSKVGNIISTICTQFHNQYNIGSCWYVIWIFWKMWKYNLIETHASSMLLLYVFVVSLWLRFNWQVLVYNISYYTFCHQQR